MPTCQALLTRAECNPNLSALNGHTPLYVAAGRGHWQAVAVLCSDLRVKVRQSRTPTGAPGYLGCPFFSHGDRSSGAAARASAGGGGAPHLRPRLRPPHAPCPVCLAAAAATAAVAAVAAFAASSGELGHASRRHGAVHREPGGPRPRRRRPHRRPAGDAAATHNYFAPSRAARPPPPEATVTHLTFFSLFPAAGQPQCTERRRVHAAGCGRAGGPLRRGAGPPQERGDRRELFRPRRAPRRRGRSHGKRRDCGPPPRGDIDKHPLGRPPLLFAAGYTLPQPPKPAPSRWHHFGHPHLPPPAAFFLLLPAAAASSSAAARRLWWCSRRWRFRTRVRIPTRRRRTARRHWPWRAGGATSVPSSRSLR